MVFCVTLWCSCYSGQYIEATVYIDPATRAVSVKLGTMDKINGTAYGFYNNTLNQTGWGILEVTARCSACENKDVMYAAGYLEGILTARYVVIVSIVNPKVISHLHYQFDCSSIFFSRVLH